MSLVPDIASYQYTERYKLIFFTFQIFPEVLKYSIFILT